MDPIALKLAKAIAKVAVVPLAKLAGERALTALEEPLTQAIPLLANLKALQLRQLRRSVEILQTQLREVQLTQEGERLLGFGNMCYRYFEAGAKEHREFKLAMLAAACAHTADANNTDRYDEQIGFFDAVERLQPVHIQILNHLDAHYNEITDGRCNHTAHPACFDDLFAADFAFPVPADFWLRRALVTLYREDTIMLWGGLGFAVNDYLWFDVQTQHAMKLNTILDNHIHWTLPNTTSIGDKFQFQLDVIVAGIDTQWAAPTGTPFTSEHTIVANDDTYHRLLEIADIPASNDTVSTIYKCKLTRIAATSNEYGSEVYISFIDCHYQKDTMGSRQEGVK